MDWQEQQNNIGQKGTENGKIILEKIYSDRAKITIEDAIIGNKQCFALTLGVSGLIVDTGFFSNLDDAIEASKLLENLVMAFIITEENP